MSKKRKQKTPPTYEQFLLTYDLCSEEVREEHREILRQQERPMYLCGEKVPENLNTLSYGQLDDMRNINPENEDVAYAMAEIIFGKVIPLYEEDVNKVFGFMNFCKKELDRINNIFASIKPTYSSEERQAGVESLDFGSFGVLDWYAKRMGIANQNDVRGVAWVRIFQCMKNDHEQNEFEKRLHDVYMGKAKR